MRPLIAALAGEHFQTADLLHHNGADLHVQGAFKSVPLHSAAGSGNFEMVQKLIEYGADIDARDEYEWTPLYWASRGLTSKDVPALRSLLECGADVNVRARTDDNVGDDFTTPLHRASAYGAVEIVRLLLENGADVEAVNVAGKTVLQVVGKAPDGEVDQGRCDEVTRLLVEHGAK